MADNRMAVSAVVVAVVVALALLSLNFEAPRSGSFTKSDADSSVNLCVVGSGIGGASAAYFMRQDFPDANIVVFEKNAFVGGRVHSFNYGEAVIEAGASIIHDRNRYMRFFSSLLEKDDAQLDRRSWGIFDGTEFLIRTAKWKLITFFRMFWRYGLDLIRLSREVNTLLSRFDKIYEHLDKGDAFETPEDLFREVGETRMSFPSAQLLVLFLIISAPPSHFISPDLHVFRAL